MKYVLLLILFPFVSFAQSDGRYIGIFVDTPDETTIIYDTIRINIKQNQANLCDANWNSLAGSTSSKLKDSYIIYHPTFNYFFVSGNKYDKNKLIVTQHTKSYSKRCKGNYFRKLKIVNTEQKISKEKLEFNTLIGLINHYEPEGELIGQWAQHQINRHLATIYKTNGEYRLQRMYVEINKKTKKFYTSGVTVTPLVKKIRGNKIAYYESDCVGGDCSYWGVYEKNPWLSTYNSNDKITGLIYLNRTGGSPHGSDKKWHVNEH